ncbi:MAG TPA: GMC oxidoreductase, partial [Candidatus Angelobacter sp.]|nr:GMC oxidoreductase [Candidatus Angelobacter sp.]
CSTAFAFLKPAMSRPNLTVRTDVQAFDIIVERGRATGVSLQQGNGSIQEHAEREIILCAGAIGSPQLLMVSGIGPADHLRSLGIPLACDLPGVGENLQDHASLPVAYKCKQPISLASAETLSNLLRYMFSKKGMLTSNVAEAGGFLTVLSGSPAPDLQFHFGPGYYVDHGFQTIEDHAFTLGPTLIRPYSRGKLKLRSSNPLDSPLIYANYFSDQRDMKVMIEGIRIARDIAGTAAFDQYRGPELLPGPAAKDESALRGHVEQYAATLYHPVGTCKMGNDAMAVVDCELRVRGVDGLRVADASVMPTVIGGNTNAPTIMIAEKAADLIKGSKSANTTAGKVLTGAA